MKTLFGFLIKSKVLINLALFTGLVCGLGCKKAKTLTSVNIINGPTANAIYCSRAFTGNHVLIGGGASGYGEIFLSQNSGASWTKVFNGSNTIRCLFNVNDTVFYAGGENAMILKTIDGGKNWTRIDLTGNTDNFYNGTTYGLFGDQHHVFACSGKNFNVGFFNRIDNGLMVEGFIGVANEMRCGIKFRDTYLGLGYGTSYVTNDTGKTIIPSKITGDFFTSCCSDLMKCYACGLNGGIYSFTDPNSELKILKPQNSAFGKNIIFNAISLTPSGKLIVVGNNGIIYLGSPEGNFESYSVNSNDNFLSITTFNQKTLITTSSGKLIFIDQL